MLIKYFSRMALLVLGLMFVGNTANQAIDPSIEGTPGKPEHYLVDLEAISTRTTEPADNPNSLEALSAPPIPQSSKALTPAGQPPLPIVSTPITSVHVVQSSYCWEMLGCADYVGGRAMLNGEPPTVIDPGDQITIKPNYEPLPAKVYVSEIREKNVYLPVALSDGVFEAPKVKGLYYYLYEAAWLTEDGKYTLNQTSAVFAVEIM
ncbi:hypothetical protein [Paenibacillus sp. P46E]|uniref:hypothetical protein n=1 Tax=Paenibacillus sp. P46E TaxID=1349436 RepID=UPI000AB3E481|nr:hypothetical protein [Paenibacillus sp. P46E]